MSQKRSKCHKTCRNIIKSVLNTQKCQSHTKVSLNYTKASKITSGFSAEKITFIGSHSVKIRPLLPDALEEKTTQILPKC